MEFIFSQIIFFLSLILLFFVPGYFLFLAVFGKNSGFHQLEKLVFYLGTSFSLVTFLMLVLGRLGVHLGRLSLTISITLFCAIFFSIYKLKIARGESENKQESELKLTRKQVFSITILILLTIFIKTIYLQNTILPTSTDLGHHMYWSKLITQTGELPSYQESEIEKINDAYAIREPKKIADFIIGEHLIFAAFAILSGNDFISSFPSLLLFLVNIFSVLSLFVLSLEIFRKNPRGIEISIATLFFIGPLYALSSPQAKFVSGGVIGNTLGNFLIPLILYFVIKSLRQKSPTLMATSIFLGLALAYTHHLSTFVFAFLIFFSLAFVVFFMRKEFFIKLKKWLKIIMSPSVLSLLIFSLFMVFYVYTPTYLNTSAIDTAIGTPSKTTRTGLSFSQLASSSGWARMVLGIIGFFLIAFLQKKKGYGSSFLLGWMLSIFLMTVFPNLLLVDIPSNRVANYVSLPLSILAGFALLYISNTLKGPGDVGPELKMRLKSSYIMIVFFVFIIFSSISGFFDNSSTISAGGKFQQALQTFRSSAYIANFTEENEVVLKDHNYITADSWMKLFFMKDYNFPLSRAYFKRYEDTTKPREQCTLLMISAPASEEGKSCFIGTNTKFIVINPHFEGAQFKKGKDFWHVYSSNDISVFYKKK